MNTRRKSTEEYSCEELKTIVDQWHQSKSRIDAELKGVYHYDVDKEYERSLCNKNLQMLFRHAAYLYRGIFESDVFLYPNEESLIIQIYKRILSNGYYSRSKNEEKKVRARLGKIVSRQYYRRYKKQ